MKRSSPDSAFSVSVSDLLADPGRTKQVRLEADVAWGLELYEVGPKVDADLVLGSVSGGLVVRGTVATEVGHTCHRCLARWTEPLTVDVNEFLRPIGEGDDYTLDGDVADLEPPIRDRVLLEAPLAPTCRDDCLGLCAVCGGDLNTGACRGHDEENDSPFAPLHDLFS